MHTGDFFIPMNNKMIYQIIGHWGESIVIVLVNNREEK